MKCPRCGRPLHPSQDPEATGYCFSCGDIYTPIRPQDVGRDWAYEQAPNGPKLRQRHARRINSLKGEDGQPRITGDGCDESPSCFTCPLAECKFINQEEPMNPEDELKGAPADPTAGLATISTRQLGNQIIASLRLLEGEYVKASARLEGVRDEATKLVKIGQLCEADIPANLLALAGKAPKPAKASEPKEPRRITRGEFPCECGQMFDTGQGRALHRRRDVCASPA